jgi:hypothetical protein
MGLRIFAVNGKKEPLGDLFPRGFLSATSDEAIIRACAAKYPGANWALAVPDGMLLVDLDVKRGNNGIREFERLQGCKPEEFVAPRVRTGTGGIHLYVDPNGGDYQNTASRIAPGIDTRAAGAGYVVLPSGNGEYRWEVGLATPMPVAPDWAKAALRRTEQIESLAAAKPYQGQTEFGFVVLSRACSRIANAPGGEQETTLNSEALKLGHYVAGGLLAYEPTLAAVIEAGMQMTNFDPRRPWTLSQVRAKAVRALRKGMATPWDDGAATDLAMETVHRRYAEEPGLHDGVLAFLAEIAAKPEPPPEDAQPTVSAPTVSVQEPPVETLQPAPPPADKPSEVQEPPKPPADKVQEPAASPQSAPEPPAKQTSQWLKPGEQVLIRRAGHGAPPPVEYLVDGLFHQVGTSLIAGKYFGGKTFVAISLAASVVTGKPFAGREVCRKGGVLWFAAEGEREVDKRIRAAVAALGCDPEDIAFWTQIYAVPKLLGNPKGVGDAIGQAKRAAKAEFGLPLGLVVFDTMIKSAGYKKSENDATETNAVILTAEDFAHVNKCHVLFIDHAGWKEDRVRGSSDKPSSVDTYGEITNGKRFKQLYFEKVKGDKGHLTNRFDIVGVMQDGQKTATIKWGEWVDDADGGPGFGLDKDDKLLYECIVEMLAEKGTQLNLYHDVPRKSVQKSAIRAEFYKRKGGTDGANRMAFLRSWDYFVNLDPPFISYKAEGKSEDNCFVFLEEGV